MGLQGGIGTALEQFASNRTDPDTGELLIEEDPAFRRYFDLLHAYENIPGMRDEDIDFVEYQNVAMHIASNSWLDWGWGYPDPSEIEHIDLAPLPVWEDMPTTRPANHSWAMMIADYSEHKDEAFEVLATYLDKELQIEMAKKMVLQTPLSDPEVLSYYGSEIPAYEGKNIDAFFVGEAAVYQDRQSNWDRFVDINGAHQRLIEENIDVNTLLRELAEESAVKIEDAKAQQ